MRFNLVALDETEYWADDITAKTGRIWGVYMYNPNEYTNCCEITPSYYLEPIDFFTENTISDELHGNMLGHWSFTDACYIHINSIKDIPKKSKDGIRLKYSMAGFADEEEAREYYQSNAMLG